LHRIFYSKICNLLSLHSAPHRPFQQQTIPGFRCSVYYMKLQEEACSWPRCCLVARTPRQCPGVRPQTAEFMPKLCPRSNIGRLSLPKQQLDISLFTYLSPWTVIKNNEITFLNLNNFLLCKGNACCSAAVTAGSSYV